MIPFGLIHLILTMTGVIFFDQESWLRLLGSFSRERLSAGFFQ